jgi:glutathione S-transferase
MKLTLHYAPLACSLVPLIALYESGAEFDVQPVSLKTGQQRSPEYLRINPKGKVPVLAVDGDALTENVAILSFIANAFPAKKLLPEGKSYYKAVSLMAWCASGLHPPITRMHMPSRVCDAPGAEENVRKIALDEEVKNFKVVDEMLAGKEWAFEHWTAVDAYLFWVWRRAHQAAVQWPEFPNYAAHAERMMKRPSVERALAYERQVQAASA